MQYRTGKDGDSGLKDGQSGWQSKWRTGIGGNGEKPSSKGKTLSLT